MERLPLGLLDKASAAAHSIVGQGIGCCRIHWLDDADGIRSSPFRRSIVGPFHIRETSAQEFAVPSAFRDAPQTENRVSSCSQHRSLNAEYWHPTNLNQSGVNAQSAG